MYTGQALAYAEAVNIWADTLDATAMLSAERNDIRAGTAPIGYAVGLGFNAVEDVYANFTSADIQRNRLFGGNESEWSAALSIANASGLSSVINNFISGGNSSAAFSFMEGIILDDANADILSNTIVALASDTAMLVDLLTSTATTRIEDNILFGEGALVVGVVEAPDSSPVSVKSNLNDPSLDVFFVSDAWGDIATSADLEIAYPAYAPNYDGAAMLANPANLDLHIGATSAALGAAGASFPAVDFDGDARPLGAAADIGADEFVE